MEPQFVLSGYANKQLSSSMDKSNIPNELKYVSISYICFILFIKSKICNLFSTHTINRLLFILTDNTVDLKFKRQSC